MTVAAEYVLDTNAYALLFQMPRQPAHLELESKVLREGVQEFLLPEIVAMEIHSVIGKYRRGGAARQEERCTREVVVEGSKTSCGHTCIWPFRRRMKAKVFGDLQKLMSDIEAKRGSIRATLLPISANEMLEAKRLLVTYSHLHAFGSHDALIAGSVAVGRRKGRELVLATSDKGLKAVCRAEGIPIFDPNHPMV